MFSYFLLYTSGTFASHASLPLFHTCNSDAMGVATSHALYPGPNKHGDKLHPAINRGEVGCVGELIHNEGILPKGPYRPCVSMAGRALLAGYPR